MVESNAILFENNEKPDHCVVIKYVPYVGKYNLDYQLSLIVSGGKCYLLSDVAQCVLNSANQ